MNENTSTLEALMDYAPLGAVGNGYIRFDDGEVTGIIYGGPYRERPMDVPGVKLAVELNHPCTVDLPIRDYSTPHPLDTGLALTYARLVLKERGAIYVGCMGGWGRTGMFLALMKKMEQETKWNTGWRKWVARFVRPEIDYVDWIRENYHQRAIENQNQEDFVHNFKAPSYRS